METDIEFLVNEYLKEHGYITEVYPIRLGAAVPPSWYIVVKLLPNVMVSVTGGVIRLEVFGDRIFLGSWDIASPTSFDDLIKAIRVYYVSQERHSECDSRMARRKRDYRRSRNVDTKSTHVVGVNVLQ